MEQTDTKRKYKAIGNRLTCNIHNVELVLKDKKSAKQLEKRMNRLIERYRREREMSCCYCRRTLRGFLWNLWGNFVWKITFGCGCRMYIRNNKSIIGGWLLSQYGYTRHPGWPSKGEIEFCQCRLTNKEKGV